MPPYRPQVWSQIKNLTTQELIRALERDGWQKQTQKGRRGKKGASTLAYRHPHRPPDKNRVVIHPHPKKTMGPKLLKQLLVDYIGWTEEDLARLKLIKSRK